MLKRTWSTETVGPTQQFTYWNDAVCQAVLNVTTERAPEQRFSGSISTVDFGSIKVASFASTGHEILRTRQQATRAKEPCYLISLQQRGVSRMRQGEAECELHAGEIGIVDAARPFRIAFPGAVARVIAVLPHHVLHARAPWLMTHPLSKLDAGFVHTKIASHYLMRLASGDAAVGETETTVLVENLCNLLALATAKTRIGEIAGRGWGTQLRCDALLAFLRRNLSDPELTPQAAAAHLGVSVRTIHKWFEQMGDSFGRWILNARLDACQRILRDPELVQMRISSIAFNWGFNDLSHFNKCFKQRFGMTPRECRETPADGLRH